MCKICCVDDKMENWNKLVVMVNNSGNNFYL